MGIEFDEKYGLITLAGFIIFLIEFANLKTLVYRSISELQCKGKLHCAHRSTDNIRGDFLSKSLRNRTWIQLLISLILTKELKLANEIAKARIGSAPRGNWLLLALDSTSGTIMLVK